MTERSESQRSIPQGALADLAELPADSRWVRSGEVRLHVLDYGGDLPPLVVLPGITSPAVALDFVARELTDLVRPIVVDVRGRGLSDAGAAYGLDDYASDTEAIIAGLGPDLGPDRPLLAGHSMGARIAAAVAVRSKADIAGTVLVDPPMSGPGRALYPTTAEVFLAQLRQAQQGTDADEVALSWPRWPRREQELRASWLASCGQEAILASHRGFETEDFFDLWPSVQGPTALLYGADSPVVTGEGAAEARRANPDALYTVIPDAGHMVFWDNPPAAVEALRAALRVMLP
ncbi:alpha/beta fold hydrolase [Embleya sp. NBC_00896]|uniref:alpha/beta fold hydrolase n=1 Tax=Embleya sp. NBC_00896 TaxID=2975961 RepID=UPI003868A9F2|nr:alpha/beta hydrolase [Embleya sp. NBC_00896]